MVRLVRFGPCGAERPGILDRRGRILDATSLVDDWSGANLSPEVLRRVGAADLDALPAVSSETRLGPPVAGIGKIIGVALNYSEHAVESTFAIPAEPFWFLKATSALSGCNDPIVIPRGAECVDWEVELAVVIGTSVSYTSEAEALQYVAGYTIINDVSERTFQLERGSQWTKGKSCDSFAPLGPWLATRDEIVDPQRLALWLDVNGVRYQSSNTGRMIAGVARLVSVASQYMSLHPGDVIATGTPARVGFAARPQRFLREGDVVELGIEGLGSQRQQVVRWSAR